MVFDGEQVAGRRFEREQLQPEKPVSGPALIVEYSSTTVVPPGWVCHVDALGNLVLEPRGAS